MSKNPQTYRNNLRPSEKVLRFFEEELVHTHAGSRLPTIKEVAQHLKVGISTVQAVFSQLSKQGRLITIQGKGTFFQQPSSPAQPNTQQRLTITILIHQRELTGTESTWGKEICAGMLHEAAQNPKNKLNIQPFFSDINGSVPELIDAEIEHSHGVIAFTGAHNRRLARQFQKAGVPTVYITPSSSIATTNFVGPDFLSLCSKVARCWKKSGRKHVLVLLHDLLGSSTTCSLSLAGIEAGLQESNGRSPTRLSYCSIDPEQREELTEYLESLFASDCPPDAIYTTGDILADFAVNWLLEQQIHIPEQVSVIGGTGLHPAHDASLTCTVVQQPFEAMGREAVRMVIRAIQNDNQPQPGKFLTASMRAGKTTRPAENLCLGLSTDAIR